MANRSGKRGTVTDFIFLSSKITANSDCIREIQRRLHLGRKAMRNLDSVLKSRDITLLTKVHIVKTMVSPVVMYQCENWTIKKAERKERKWSRSVMSDSLWPHGLYPARLLCPWNSLGKSTGVGCHLFLQGIFPTQGSNPRLMHCRQTLYHLSHQGSL